MQMIRIAATVLFGHQALDGTVGLRHNIEYFSLVSGVCCFVERTIETY